MNTGRGLKRTLWGCTVDDKKTEDATVSERRAKGLIRQHVVQSGVSGKLQRARAIEEQISAVEGELRERKDFREKQKPGTVERKLNEKTILAKIAEQKKLLREFEYCMSMMVYDAAKVQHEDLTREEIDRARSYPIEDLIEVKRGIARCISGTHADKNPSMDVRNNFVYCYACGFSGDAITVSQKLHGGSFQDVVRRLQ